VVFGRLLQKVRRIGVMIKYKSGYKYQLVQDVVFNVRVFPERDIITKYIELSILGCLTIRSGYAWDGPSGPTIDTKNFMQGSLVHDALYQLMRMRLLDSSWRLRADQELVRICKEDGMSKLRSWYVYRSVRRLAASAANPKNAKKVITAP